MHNQKVSAADKKIRVIKGNYKGVYYARYSGSTVFLFSDAKRLHRIGVTTVSSVEKV